MNEAETRAEHIDPALKAAGWGVVEGSRIRREYPITPGRIEGQGRRGKPLTADYVLEFRNTKLGVVEAKALDEELTEGVGQAKNYAGKLAVRYAYSTNGRGIYQVDMSPDSHSSHSSHPPENEISRFPTPDELWAMTFAKAEAWRDRFAAVPFEDKGGSHPSRYYQDTAIQRVMEAIAAGVMRILLTLATGTGKTFIAFQIAWKLFHARWSLTGQPTRRPRILFLAVRNTHNVITWSAVSGRVYSVYWSTNLVKGFQVLETNILYPRGSYTNATPDPRVNHYQIKVRLQ